MERGSDEPTFAAYSPSLASRSELGSPIWNYQRPRNSLSRWGTSSLRSINGVAYNSWREIDGLWTGGKADRHCISGAPLCWRKCFCSGDTESTSLREEYW